MPQLNKSQHPTKEEIAACKPLLMREADGIPVHCACDELSDVASLVPFDPNPNKHPPEQIELYAKLIKTTGWRVALVRSNRSGMIVKGNGALLAAKQLGVKCVPVNNQDFSSENEERAFVIADNRLPELSNIDRSLLRDLAEAMDDGAFDMDLTGFDNKALEELMTATAPANKRPPAPVVSFTYKMTRLDKPRESELLNTVKTQQLIKKIKKRKLPKEQEEFLIAAAQRHSAFHFENIAEYYAHSAPDVQELMEESALIILDFNRAIELGFVKMTDGIQALVNGDPQE